MSSGVEKKMTRRRTERIDEFRAREID